MTNFSDFTHDDINWEQLWQNARRRKGWASKGAAEWDKKAPSFASRNLTSPYTELLLSHLPLAADMTVLDVGCGPGNLTLPIATRVRAVSALDFSQKMLDILAAEAQTQHLRNISVHKCAWEDDWSTLNIPPHDLAIASRSLSVDNLTAAITKLDALATRYVFIADRISPTPFDPEAFHAVGRPFQSGPDYIYTINILYTMGIHANVTLLELDRESTYQDIEQAYFSYSWMIKDLTGKEEERLRRFLERKAVPTADGRLAIRRENPPRWALIWWAKRQGTAMHDSTPR